MDGFSLALLAAACGLVTWEHRDALRAPPPRPRARAGARRCPYCHEELAPAEETTRCRRCDTVHHRGCWEQHGACSVHGCGRPPARASREEASAEEVEAAPAEDGAPRDEPLVAAGPAPLLQ